MWRKFISFNQIEIFERDKKSKIKNYQFKNIKKLPLIVRRKISEDLKDYQRVLLKKSHLLMGILNMTPDSFQMADNLILLTKHVKE